MIYVKSIVMTNKLLREDFKRLAITLILVIAIMALLVVLNQRTGFLNQFHGFLVKTDDISSEEQQATPTVLSE